MERIRSDLPRQAEAAGILICSTHKNVRNKIWSSGYPKKKKKSSSVLKTDLQKDSHTGVNWAFIGAKKPQRLNLKVIK